MLEESQAQIKLAEADVNDIEREDVLAVKGHLLSLILLNKSIQYVEQLSRQNLIPEAAASELLGVLDEYVDNIWVCQQLAHCGRLATSVKVEFLQKMPKHIQEEFNIYEAIDDLTNTNTETPGSPPSMRIKRTNSLKRSNSYTGNGFFFRPSTPPRKPLMRIKKSSSESILRSRSYSLGNMDAARTLPALPTLFSGDALSGDALEGTPSASTLQGIPNIPDLSRTNTSSNLSDNPITF